MKICYLGPVERQPVLQGYASAGVVVEARHPGSRTALESVYDEYAEIPAQLDEVRRAESDGCHAVIIGCFGDPGVDAAREIVTIPVVGLGETSLTIASMLGTRLGVVTPLQRLLPATLRQVRSAGLSSRLISIESADLCIREIRDNPEEAFRSICAAARKCYDGGADSLALACGSMSFYAERLQAELGIPVVHGLRVAVRFAELLVSAGLTFSKRSYPCPASEDAGGQGKPDPASHSHTGRTPWD
jgi:allantoin racemase